MLRRYVLHAQLHVDVGIMEGCGITFKKEWVASWKSSVLLGFVFTVGLYEDTSPGVTPCISAALCLAGAPNFVPGVQSILLIRGSRSPGFVCC